MSNPRVSVIMGVYNGAETLKRAVDSILAQTYSDWELIICDDGSVDDTYKIAVECKQKDSRIKVIQNEKNMRLAYSLNQCLKIAKGEYIARMDADDISLPERFEKQVAYLDQHPEMSVVGTAAIVFDENGDKLIRGLGVEYPMKKQMHRSTPFMHVTIMMRKSAYDLLGGYRVSPETMRAEDLDLWYRFRIAKLEGYVLQEPLVRICERTQDFKRRSVKAALGIVCVHKKYFKLLKIPRKYTFLIYKPLISALLPRKFMA
ncbi:MAG: glycosyltransferase, partial [Clostridia bacterium]|nr:glycosyltransferase [Clostridia bacterium]